MSTLRSCRSACAVLSGTLAAVMMPGEGVLAQGESELEEVTVTGTRIQRRDFSSRSPIVTVEAETFDRRTNIGLESTLNQLPQFTAAGTQASTSSAATAFPQATAAPGAATVNLRGLGLNRSLVLLDGRRVQPVNGELVVDLNTIPSAAIERVEVITGGAAAVYGADAIGGVVNFILKKDFTGVEFSGQYGVSQEGDGAETTLSGLMGANFADGRGNVMIGANYSEREIIHGGDRDWVVEGWEDPGTMGGAVNSSNLSQFSTAPMNEPTAGFTPQESTYTIDQNGNVFDAQDPLNPDQPYTGPLGDGSGFKINPDGSLGYNDREHSYLQLPLERFSLFGTGHIELADNVELFSEMRFSETYTTSSGATSGLFNIWSPMVPYNPQYDDPSSPDFGDAPATVAQHPVPQELATLLTSRPDNDAPWQYSGGLDYLGNFVTETTSNVYQIVGGLRGDMTVAGNDWSWEFYASHGNTSVNAHQPSGFPNFQRMQNLFNADQYGEGFTIAELPDFVPVAVTGTCTSGLPIFSADGSVDNTPAVSEDCADYAVQRMNNITRLSQDVIEGSVTGDLVEMPAGALQFAAGVNYRREEFEFDPDSGYTANQDYPDVVQNVILPVGVDGVTDVSEVFGELSIPLVSDRPLVQSFALDIGVRYSEYNTVGSVDTYKFLTDWTVNDHVRVRGGYQLANRAPNVTELFTPAGQSQIESGTDACANYPDATQPWGNRPENPNRLNVQTLCQHLMTREGAPPSLYEPGQPSANNYAYNVFGATTPFQFSIGVTEGNPELDSESSDTYTAGVVLSFERLTLSLDWFRIELEDAIGTPGHDTVYQRCLDARFNNRVGAEPGEHTGAELAAGSPFCDLIQREYLGGPPETPGNFAADRKFNARYLNTGGLVSEGVDIQADWGTEFENLEGALNLNVQLGFLDRYAESPFPGAEFVDYTGTTTNSSFDYQLFSTLSYGRGPMTVGMRWQHLPSVEPAPSAAEATLPVDSHNEIGIFGNWNLSERYRLRAGIDNLLDADPEVVGATPSDANLGTTNSNYDQIGRRVYFGVTATL